MQNFQIMDYTSFFTDVVKASYNGVATWGTSYSFQQAFGNLIAGLSPTNPFKPIQLLATALFSNVKLSGLYSMYRSAFYNQFQSALSCAIVSRTLADVEQCAASFVG